MLHLSQSSLCDEIPSHQNTASSEQASILQSDSSTQPNISAHPVTSPTEDIQISVLRATARIKIYSPNNWVIVRALLDQGSEATFITTNLIQLLNVPRVKQDANIYEIRNVRFSSHHTTRIVFGPVSRSVPTHSTTAHILPSLSEFVPNHSSHHNHWAHIKQLALANDNPLSSDPIDVIVRANLYGSLLLHGVVKGRCNEPVAQNTTLGLIISGPIAHSSPSINVTAHVTLLEKIDHDIKRFWELEEIPTKHQYTSEEQACEEHFKSIFSCSSSGLYIVRLPFRSTPPTDLRDSRLLSVVCKIKKND